MGFTASVSVPLRDVEFRGAPVPSDETLYVPRYFEDAKRHNTTRDYVEYNLSPGHNTYLATRRTMWALAAMIVVTGLGSVVAIGLSAW